MKVAFLQPHPRMRPARRQTARWAAAAGITGMLANALLVAFYAFEVGRGPLGPVSLGSANDIVGSISTAMMVPVATAFGPPRVRRLGLAAMGVLTVAGPLLVLGILSFDVQLPIVLGALLALAAWMLLTGRHLAGAVPPAVSRLAVLAGAGVLWGLPVAGMGVLLPPVVATAAGVRRRRRCESWRARRCPSGSCCSAAHCRPPPTGAGPTVNALRPRRRNSAMVINAAVLYYADHGVDVEWIERTGRDGARTTFVAVPRPGALVEVARGLADQGIHAIELCGGMGLRPARSGPRGRRRAGSGRGCAPSIWKR